MDKTAQTPGTPLELTSCCSEFPSLSNNQPQPSQSTWAASGNRNIGPSGNMRLQQQQQQQSPLSSQQQVQHQQEDLFNSSSQLPSSGMGFRFGNQNAVGQSSQPSSADEFPPLNNRSASGEIGQDRAGSLMHNNIGFGQPNGLGFGSSNPPQSNRSNGLLNALSGSNRTPSGNRVASPTSISGDLCQKHSFRMN